MLKEKKTTEPTVLAFKLVTGEEIIALKVSDDVDFVHVKKPLSMVMTENPDNPQQTRVVFTPWMVAAGQDIVMIKINHIVAATVAREDAATQYIAATE